jgi:hypothetical protein
MIIALVAQKKADALGQPSSKQTAEPSQEMASRCGSEDERAGLTDGGAARLLGDLRVGQGLFHPLKHNARRKTQQIGTN